ncbi:hypothetical protein ABMA32_01515 [Mesorhizobium sp. VNQ89]|uniref:hypothetical protein n=1 Tax=Mesorhizobium quangtriensis TaxID=3157709 RepID=UPI0032B7BB5C
MSGNENDDVNSLRQEIRKQFGSAATTRFVRNIPAFRVDNAMPERFTNLLAELDRTEAGKSGHSD